MCSDVCSMFKYPETYYRVVRCERVEGYRNINDEDKGLSLKNNQSTLRLIRKYAFQKHKK